MHSALLVIVWPTKMSFCLPHLRMKFIIILPGVLSHWRAGIWKADGVHITQSETLRWLKIWYWCYDRWRSWRRKWTDVDVMWRRLAVSTRLHWTNWTHTTLSTWRTWMRSSLELKTLKHADWRSLRSWWKTIMHVLMPLRLHSTSFLCIQLHRICCHIICCCANFSTWYWDQWVGGVTVWHRTLDETVMSSIPGQVTIR